GPEFPTADLRVVTGQPDAQLAEVVAEAVAAGVLARSPAGDPQSGDPQSGDRESGDRESGDRVAFRHGLIRQALSDGVPGRVRLGLHRHAAQALAEAGMPAERVAEHLLAAPSEFDDWVVGWV